MKVMSKMNEEEVNRCQIQEWYPKFKTHAIRTRIHQLPELFVDYLLDDSKPFLLPVSVADDDALPNRVRNPGVDSDCQLSESSDDDDGAEAPSFPELELAVKDSVEALGGAAFPKLNWSAPKDAAWIATTGNLRCTSLSEIALLLRSSDSVVHDLCHAYDSCSGDGEAKPRRSRPEIFLALRKWYDLEPDKEFRCFVKDRSLIGVSQRETTTFYPATLAKKAGLQTAISEFFSEAVRERFESENYTFDVYVTKMETVKLVDFNTWRGSTLPLLFTWEELEEITNGEIEMRIVESRQGVRPGLKTAVPYDYLDTSAGSGWDQFLKNADHELQRQSSEETCD